EEKNISSVAKILTGNDISPITKVLTDTNLLLVIFSHLSKKSLHVTKKVCKQWRQLVNLVININVNDKNVSSEVGCLREELFDLWSKNVHLEEMNVKYESKIHNLEAELEDEKKNNEKLTEQIDELREQTKTFKTRSHNLQKIGKITQQLEQEKAKLEQENARLKDKNRYLENKLNKLELDECRQSSSKPTTPVNINDVFVVLENLNKIPPSKYYRRHLSPRVKAKITLRIATKAYIEMKNQNGVKTGYEWVIKKQVLEQ
ncbi:10612_t:CDS:2, partial [Ambispora gerdemannii]